MPTLTLSLSVARFPAHPPVSSPGAGPKHKPGVQREGLALLAASDWDIFAAMESKGKGKSLTGVHLKQLAILKAVWSKELAGHRMRMLKVLSATNFDAERETGPAGWPAADEGGATGAEGDDGSDDDDDDDDDEDEDASLAD